MADKYPEVLRVESDGERRMFGIRHNHCFTSPVYREKVKQINTRLAERYGSHPAGIAWHISNEYSGACFCPLCREAFRNYLRKRYDNDINKLNHAYWSTFWSHRYDNFEQIEPPMDKGVKSINCLVVDWKRFTTYQTCDFMKAEIEAIKKICPGLPTTTNMMGMFEGLDYSTLGEYIDVASWDSYPFWHQNGSGDEHIRQAYSTAFCHDFYRSMKQRPFMLMESAPGVANWHPVNHLKRPGMDRLQSIQAVAHGSDSVQYFQFRKGRGSQEKFHGAVVDHVGTDETRVFKAVADTGRTLADIAEIAGTMPNTEVAILYSWESRWALNFGEAFILKNKGYEDECFEYYRPLWERGISVDIIPPHADLSKYKLIVIPMLYMADAETIGNIKRYVANGGVVYAAHTLGFVDENDLCHLGGFPGGDLKEVFGLWNEETDSLYPEETSRVVMNDGEDFFGKELCELVHSRGAEVLATYSADFYEGSPAFLKNTYGKGIAYYQAFRDKGGFKDRIIGEIVDGLKIERAIDIEFPYGVVAHSRQDEENKYVFIENYSGESIDSLPLDGTYFDLEASVECSTVSLDRYDVRILKKL